MLKNIVTVILLAILANYIYYLYKDYTNAENESTEAKNIRIFSYKELIETKNQKDRLYLAILGKVYDVTKGGKHYAPGGSYDFFVGINKNLQKKIF